MKEVSERLFVGNGLDFGVVRDDAEWSIVTCAKEPWHREALGYTGRGAPRDSPEYLYALRGRRLILNMIDADRAAFFHPDMMNRALEFIEAELAAGQSVLIHCNQGFSRAPGLALLYLFKKGLYPDRTYDQGETEFRHTLYEGFEPGAGIREYVRTEWRRPQVSSPVQHSGVE